MADRKYFFFFSIIQKLGTGQPSDDEILQKALELSRMDFMQSIMQRAGSTSP